MYNETNYNGHSVQSSLFALLNAEQQQFMRPIMRPLKHWAQVEMASAMLDYLEHGVVISPDSRVVADLFDIVLKSQIFRPLNNI